jgi:hypothetical protein
MVLSAGPGFSTGGGQEGDRLSLQIVVRRRRPGHRGVRGDVSRDPGDRGRDGAVDRRQRQQHVLQRGQLDSVTRDGPGLRRDLHSP